MYINAQTNQYPISEQEIRNLNPNVSYATPFKPGYPYMFVFPTPHPEHNAITQTVQEKNPVRTIKGHYEQSWKVVPRFTEYTDDQGIVHSVAEQEAAAIAANQQAIAASEAAALIALQDSIIQATQQRLDDFAKTRRYDGIQSLCTYANSSIANFKAEGQYGITARDSTWAKLLEILAEVEAGTGPTPSGYSDVEQELPTLQWPV